MGLDDLLDLLGQVPFRRHQRTGFGVIDPDHSALDLRGRFAGRDRLLRFHEVGRQDELADVVQQPPKRTVAPPSPAACRAPAPALRSRGNARGMQPEPLAIMTVARIVALQELGRARGEHETANAAETEDHDGLTDRRDRPTHAVERRVHHREHLRDENLVVLHQLLEILRLGVLPVEHREHRTTRSGSGGISSPRCRISRRVRSCPAI